MPSFAARPFPNTSGFVPWGSAAAAPAFTAWAPVAANEVEPEPDAPAFDPEMIEAARRVGYEAGFADGAAALDEEVAALHRLAESLQQLRPEPAGPLALLLVETVDRLVRQVVGEVAIDPALLLERAHAAAQLIVDEARPAALRVNPADLARLQGADLSVGLAADEDVAPGSVVIESADGWVEDGVAARLDSLRAGLTRIAA